MENELDTLLGPGVLPGYSSGYVYGKGFSNDPWRSGGTQLHHLITRETLNAFEVTRELLFFKDANGNPLYNGRDFGANGLEEPSRPDLLDANNPNNPARAGHPNGRNHPRLQETLLTQNWIGGIEKGWLDAKRIAAALPLNERLPYLKQEALKAAAELHAAEAVLRDLQVDHFDANGNLIRGAININDLVNDPLNGLTLDQAKLDPSLGRVYDAAYSATIAGKFDEYLALAGGNSKLYRYVDGQTSILAQNAMRDQFYDAYATAKSAGSDLAHIFSREGPLGNFHPLNAWSSFSTTKIGKAIGFVGKVGGFVLGAIGLASMAPDAAEASQRADALRATGDNIGADAVMAGFLAREATGTGRLIAALSIAQGNLPLATEVENFMADTWVDQVEKGYIRAAIDKMVAAGQDVPAKYRDWYNNEAALPGTSVTEGQMSFTHPTTGETLTVTNSLYGTEFNYRNAAGDGANINMPSDENGLWSAARISAGEEVGYSWGSLTGSRIDYENYDANDSVTTEGFYQPGLRVNATHNLDGTTTLDVSGTLGSYTKGGITGIGPKDIIRTGELIGTGALAKNIAGDFLNGIAKGTVSPFNQADVNLANSVAQRLPAGGIAEFLGSAAGQALEPGRVDPKIAAAWDITKTIQETLRGTAGGIPENLDTEIRKLSTRLAASGNAIAAMPLLGNHATREDLWNSVRKSLSILDAGRALQTGSAGAPKNSGALSARNAMVAAGTPTDIANQAARQAESELARRAGSQATFSNVEFDLNLCTGPLANLVPGVSITNTGDNCVLIQQPPAPNSDLISFEFFGGGGLLSLASATTSASTTVYVDRSSLGGPIEEVSYSFGGVDGLTPTMVAAKLTTGATVTGNFGADGRGGSNDTLTVEGWDAEVHHASSGGGYAPPPLPAAITLSEVGTIFGSTLGNYLAGDNTFAKVAAGSALAAVLSTAGGSFDRYFGLDGAAPAANFETAIEQGFSQFGTNLFQAVQAQSLGAISNFLTAELADALGIDHTVEGALVQNVGNALINRAVANVASTGNPLNVFAGFGEDAFNLPVVLSDGTQLAGGAAFDVGQGISGFVGSYLASKIVTAQTIGGDQSMLAANDNALPRMRLAA